MTREIKITLVFLASLAAIIALTIVFAALAPEPFTAMEKAMEKQLFAAEKNDFVEYEGGRLALIWEIWPKSNGIIICASIGAQCGYNTHTFLSSQARSVKKLIRKSDPEYPGAAIKFIAQR